MVSVTFEVTMETGLGFAAVVIIPWLLLAFLGGVFMQQWYPYTFSKHKGKERPPPQRPLELPPLEVEHHYVFKTPPAYQPQIFYQQPPRRHSEQPILARRVVHLYWVV